MEHVFISYVREDAHVANYIAEVLRANGIDPWIDKADLAPGQRWQAAIRDAIGDGAFYFSLFSKNWARREKTYANEELTLAIEEIRKRPHDKAWFIPIRIDDCVIPNRPIGGGETLSDLQRVDFFGEGITNAMRQLLVAIGIEDPILDVGKPLAPGLRSTVDISGGTITSLKMVPHVPIMQGLVFTVTGGYVARAENGKIFAQIATQAPMAPIQDLNKMLGTDTFIIASDEEYISSNSQNTTEFGFQHRFVIPKGTDYTNPADGTMAKYLEDVNVETNYKAHGFISAGVFSGAAVSRSKFNMFGQIQSHELQMEFSLKII